LGKFAYTGPIKIGPVSDSPLPYYYRDQAKHLREIAGSMEQPGARKELECSLKQYDRLAGRIEEGDLGKGRK